MRKRGDSRKGGAVAVSKVRTGCFSCSETLPPQKIFPRTQTSTLPGPACQEHNHPGRPCPQPGMLTSIERERWLFTVLLMYSSQPPVTAPWLLDRGRHWPTASPCDSFCLVSGSVEGRVPCAWTLSPSPCMRAAQEGGYGPWPVKCQLASQGSVCSLDRVCVCRAVAS